MADIVLTPEMLNKTKTEIENTLISAGVDTVLLIDEAGNILATSGRNTENMDVTSLAALAAANFGATLQIAKLIGEDDFSLLFHKGENGSIHFARIIDDLILISIFGDKVSLGLVRLRVVQLTKSIGNIFSPEN